MYFLVCLSVRSCAYTLSYLFGLFRRYYRRLCSDHGSYCAHLNVWLTVAEFGEGNLVFPKLIQLTNHIPPVLNACFFFYAGLVAYFRTASKCHRRQYNSARRSLAKSEDKRDICTAEAYQKGTIRYLPDPASDMWPWYRSHIRSVPTWYRKLSTQ